MGTESQFGRVLEMDSGGCMQCDAPDVTGRHTSKDGKFYAVCILPRF